MKDSAQGTPLFFVSNFGKTITIQMNIPMALRLFDVIREAEERDGEVDKALYSLTEKIENRFYFMNELTTRGRKNDESSDLPSVAENNGEGMEQLEEVEVQGEAS
jgi:hypothetical protein